MILLIIFENRSCIDRSGDIYTDRSSKSSVGEANSKLHRPVWRHIDRSSKCWRTKVTQTGLWRPTDRSSKAGTWVRSEFMGFEVLETRSYTDRSEDTQTGLVSRGGRIHGF